MVEHTFSKLYSTILYLWLSDELESHHLKAKGQANFHLEYQTTNHIFTLRAIIEEAHYRFSKVFYFFVVFQKAFDTILIEALFQQLHDIGISKTLRPS
jgi:hypothetical protein